MKTVLMKKKIICESSDDSDFFSDDYSEESLDKYFEEMGAIGKDSSSKYSEIAILRSFILKHNFSKNAKNHLTKLVKCLSKNVFSKKETTMKIKLTLHLQKNMKN